MPSTGPSAGIIAGSGRLRHRDSPFPVRRQGVGRISRREMGSLVAQPGGAEEGVHQGVDQNIAIAVTGQSAVVGDRRAAQHQGAPGGQGVGVDADADTVVRGGLGQGCLALIRAGSGGR